MAKHSVSIKGNIKKRLFAENKMPKYRKFLVYIALFRLAQLGVESRRFSNRRFSSLFVALAEAFRLAAPKKGLKVCVVCYQRG